LALSVRRLVLFVCGAGDPLSYGCNQNPIMSPRMKDTLDASELDPEPCQRVRALFLSDLHLGTRAFQADRLLDFLRLVDADVIYLVGDIIDFWKVRRGPHWPQRHNDVLQKLLRKVRKGTRLIVVPGNHDEVLRDYAGMNFGGIEIHETLVHITGRGRRYVVMHGDEFDVVVRNAKWVALLGDKGYECALWLNTPLNWVRRHLGFGYWSLSAYLKQRVKKAVAFIGAFEEAVASEARRRAVHGIICGHIHHAADRTFKDVHYLNCGDWVESCTAVVETMEGHMRVIYWGKPAVRLIESKLSEPVMVGATGIEPVTPSV
jgi:UDP-2,3-diacylglucosamine pyrophosphatase LpxH